MSSKETLIAKHGEEGYRKLMAEWARKRWANYDPAKKKHRGGLNTKQARRIQVLGGKASSRRNETEETATN